VVFFTDSPVAAWGPTRAFAIKKSAMAENLLNRFVCIRCGATHAPKPAMGTCADCGGNLDARYDYAAAARSLSPVRIRENRDPGPWRYAPLLPTGLGCSPLALPVGNTPLFPARRLAARLGLDNLWIKNDSLNPSGSFKDRASLMVLAHCLEHGIGRVSAASTGNAGTSMACLAAAAGLATVIFVPATAPPAKIAQLMIYGARVFPVRGDYRQAFELCDAVSRRLGWYNRSTGINPYTREGKKTVAFEIWEQRGFTVPDAVVVSVGDGNIISGIHKGFADLHRAGLTHTVPRIIGVQSERSAAIARAFHGDGTIRPVTADTVADSISAAVPSDGEAALAAVHQSGGTFVTVPDPDILKSVRTLAETEGVFAEPSGAAGVAGLEKLLSEGMLTGSETVALVVTGSGLKDVDAAFKVTGQAETVDPDPDTVISMLKKERP
jgi:threonine synthase